MNKNVEKEKPIKPMENLINFYRNLSLLKISKGKNFKKKVSESNNIILYRFPIVLGEYDFIGIQ